MMPSWKTHAVAGKKRKRDLNGEVDSVDEESKAHCVPVVKKVLRCVNFNL